MESETKIDCAKCFGKGLFKCEGCQQRFCLEHTNEHRQSLHRCFDELLNEQEEFLQEFSRQNQFPSRLIDQIDRWEQSSIEQIRQTAENLRSQIEQMTKLQTEQNLSRFVHLKCEVEQARKNEQYLERDLYRWKILFEQLKCDLSVLSPTIELHQDQHRTLIHPVTIIQRNVESLIDESLVSYSSDIHLDEHRHLAIHCGLERAPAYLSGTREYSRGKHRLRLFLNKQSRNFVLSFNVMSTLMSMPPESNSPWLVYGWQSDDCVQPSSLSSSNEKTSTDLRGHRRFLIEFLLDCDQRKIGYFNERTRCEREINVDLEKCPLPWKIFFYLYDIGDSVRLLSTSSDISKTNH